MCYAKSQLAALPRVDCRYSLPDLHMRKFGLRRIEILALAKDSDYLAAYAGCSLCPALLQPLFLFLVFPK